MEKLENLANKLNLSVEFCKEILIWNHVLNNLTPKKNIKIIRVNLEDNVLSLLKKVSKDLKVTESAVVCACAVEMTKLKEGTDESINS